MLSLFRPDIPYSKYLQPVDDVTTSSINSQKKKPNITYKEPLINTFINIIIILCNNCIPT
jgi:hypothetical protein